MRSAIETSPTAFMSSSRLAYSPPIIGGENVQNSALSSIGWARSLEDRRCGSNAAFQRRSGFECASGWIKSCGIHVYAWVLLGTGPTARDVGIRSFWDCYGHRSKCRPDLAE